MNIEKHISGLLFEHDCVIVPDFGGFVCNYSSSKIHFQKHQFHPPFKKISFNRNLKNNDGLLAARISLEEMISYPEANRLTSECIAEWNKKLRADKRVDLKSIGTFYLGEENTILFEQDETVNYLPESFGLRTFFSPAIRREPIEIKIKRNLKDKAVILSKEKKETGVRKKIPVARYLAVAASVLIIASLIFVSLKTDLLRNTGFANLNPLSGTSALYHSSKIILPETDIAQENISDMLSNDTMQYMTITLDKKIPIVVQLREGENEMNATRKTEYETQNRFHIVGGAFAIPENAHKFCKKLLELGYDATIINKKFIFVTYGGFSSREDAIQALDKIRAVQKDAWLMKM